MFGPGTVLDEIAEFLRGAGNRGAIDETSRAGASRDRRALGQLADAGGPR